MKIVGMIKEKLLALLKGIAPRYLVVLYLVLVGAVGVAVSSLILYPQELRILELERQILADRQKLNAVESFILAHPNTEQYLTELQRSQARTEFLLPSQIDVAKYVEQLEKDARASGVKLLNIKPSAAADKAGYREMPVELSVEGSFYSIMSFIKKMEDGERFSVPTAFLIQPKQNTLMARMNLQVFAYGNPPRSAPAAPAPKAP